MCIKIIIEYNMLRLFIVLLLIPYISFGQEICNNCIDDDNDGLIDCYDPECYNNNIDCEDFYIGNPSTNTLTSCTGNFGFSRMWNYTGPTQGIFEIKSPIIGDIDNDDTIEVIMEKYIINGATGALKSTINVGNHAYPPAIGDVDGDGFAEIFLHNDISLNGIIRVEHDNLSARTWTSANPGSMTSNKYYDVSLADFNEDGIAEVYWGGVIINAVTGDILVDQDSLIIIAKSPNNTSPTIAIDILPDTYCTNCEGLELVNSTQVFAVDVENGILEKVSILQSGEPAGYFAVADFNNDRSLDIIVRGWSPHMMYVWDPRTEQLISSTYPLTIGGGIPAVGNLDLDPELEIVIAQSDGLLALDHDLSLKWKSTYDNDGSFVPALLFDFNCDGIMEVLFRGRNDIIAIYVGSNGYDIASSSGGCGSATLFERPAIADIDKDGHADIVSGCDDLGISAWRGGPFEFASARSVVNQYNYYSSGVNDDLTIACGQQNFSQAGIPDEVNCFMCQQHVYDEEGLVCVGNDMDLAVTIDSISALSGCDSMRMIVKICNIGDQNTSTNNIPIQIYQVDENGNHIIISSEIIDHNLSNTVCYTIILDLDLTTDSKFFIVANDDGTDPEDLPTLFKPECHIGNNLLYIYTPDYEAIPTVDIGDDTTICDTASIILHAPIGADSYQWSTGDIGDSIITGIDSIYSLFIIYSPGCEATDTVNIRQINCESPIYEVFIPNAFSPNGDGIQDVFQPILKGYIVESFSIYDRWGKRVYNKNSNEILWDGTINSNIASLGTYVYQLHYKTDISNDIFVQKGTIQVIK